MPPQHTHVPPVQNNQPGTGFGSWGRLVGLVPSVTPLGTLPAPRMGARGAIWAHIQIFVRTAISDQINLGDTCPIISPKTPKRVP